MRARESAWTSAFVIPWARTRRHAWQVCLFRFLRAPSLSISIYPLRLVALLQSPRVRCLCISCVCVSRRQPLSPLALLTARKALRRRVRAPCPFPWRLASRRPLPLLRVAWRLFSQAEQGAESARRDASRACGGVCWGGEDAARVRSRARGQAPAWLERARKQNRMQLRLSPLTLRLDKLSSSPEPHCRPRRQPSSSRRRSHNGLRSHCHDAVRLAAASLVAERARCAAPLLRRRARGAARTVYQRCQLHFAITTRLWPSG